MPRIDDNVNQIAHYTVFQRAKVRMIYNKEFLV